MNINLYLFKDSVKDFGDVKEKALEEGFAELDAKPKIVHSGLLVMYKNEKQTKEISWLDFLSPGYDVTPFKVDLYRPGAIVFIQADKRIFALTFGTGHYGLDRSKLVPDFGLQVAFRTLKGGSLSLVDIRNFEAKNRQQRASLSLKGGLPEFGLNVDAELTYRLSGVPDDAYFGKKLVGGTALAFASDLSLGTTVAMCKKIIAILAKPVKKDFVNLNQFELVTDETEVKGLDQQLVNKLAKGDFSDCSVAMPDIDDVLCPTFMIGTGQKKQALGELTLQEIKANLAGIGMATFKDLTTVRVFGADDSEETLTTRYTLKDVVVAKLPGKKKDQFVLSMGRWYRVSTSFIKQVDKEVKQIEVITDPNFLPKFKAVRADGSNNTEPKYNEHDVTKARADAKFMDCNNWKGLGYDKVEVCDFYTPNRELICIKRYSCSQTMSALLAQGSVSAAFLKNESTYREFLAKEVGAIGKFDPATVNLSDFTIVYGVVMPGNRKVPEDLPLFTKVNLLDHVARIRALSVGVRLYTIPTDGVVPKKAKAAKTKAAKAGTKPTKP